MTSRKPRMAAKDDQTRRFCVQPCLVPTPENELLMAVGYLRFALQSFDDAAMPDILDMLDAIEAAVQEKLQKSRRSAFRR